MVELRAGVGTRPASECQGYFTGDTWGVVSQHPKGNAEGPGGCGISEGVVGWWTQLGGPCCPELPVTWEPVTLTLLSIPMGPRSLMCQPPVPQETRSVISKSPGWKVFCGPRWVATTNSHTPWHSLKLELALSVRQMRKWGSKPLLGTSWDPSTPWARGGRCGMGGAPGLASTPRRWSGAGRLRGGAPALSGFAGRGATGGNGSSGRSPAWPANPSGARGPGPRPRLGGSRGLDGAGIPEGPGEGGLSAPELSRELGAPQRRGCSPG